MKLLIIGIAFLVGIIVGIIVPLSIPSIRNKVVSSVEEMEEVEERLDELNFDELNIPEIKLEESVESIKNAKSILLSLESGKIDSAKSALIEEIGTFYFTWNHEDDRDLNDEVINKLLNEIETDSNKSKGLKAAIKFKLEE